MIIVDCTSVEPAPEVGAALRQMGEAPVYLCAPGQLVPEGWPCWREDQRVCLPLDGDPSPVLEAMIDQINALGRAKVPGWVETRRFCSGRSPQTGRVYYAQLWTSRPEWAPIARRYGLTFVGQHTGGPA